MAYISNKKIIAWKHFNMVQCDNCTAKIGMYIAWKHFVMVKCDTCTAKSGMNIAWKRFCMAKRDKIHIKVVLA